MFTADRQLPVGEQLVPAQLNPCLHQAELLPGQLPGKNLAVGNADRCLMFSVAGMNMRMMMP
jgi:hypothetical protein